ncbi:MAG: ClpX C4-type zinc finger protein [Candidatus Thiodiazotropha sp. (ex Codakia rugifera)]|nr:ClpX C4-type zinc finger protein [Candidatus Thiodiazotropha sp. (ex Codakia rugifera)]
MDSPPPIIDSCKLLFYASNEDDVTFTDRISLFVGGSGDELKPIGEVQNLAISRTYYEPHEFLLMFCKEDWAVKGVIPFTTIEEAKTKAEKGYNGISSKWKMSPYNEEDIDDFLRDEYEVDPKSEWWTTICSFCGRKDTEFSRLLEGKHAVICEGCVNKFYKVFNENA